LQGSDGNFYGTAYGGGITNTACTQGCGTAFKIAVSPALAAPVQVILSSTSANVGDGVTLTWKVLNGFSKTLQQCYAFVLNNTSGAGTWTGLQTGSIVNGAYTGSTTITPTATGTYTYALTCGGTESASASLNVGDVKSPTSVALTSNSPFTLGSLVTLTATPSTTQYVAQFTGSVAFSYGAASLGTVILNVNGVASLDLTASGIPIGTYPIKAAYSGDANYQPSSATTNVVVLGYATTTALNVTPASVTQGQSVKLSATVTRTSGTPTGSVTFYYGATFLGKANLSNGTASLTAATSSSSPPGTYAITAKYSGDSSDQSSTSPVEDVAVIAVTSTTLTVSPNPVPADSSLTITATVKETYDSGIPTGTVLFSFGSDSLGSVALTSGTATVNASDFGIAAGTYPVTATYSGDANNAASTKTVNLVIQ
jgi:hypothetical protein